MMIMYLLLIGLVMRRQEDNQVEMMSLSVCTWHFLNLLLADVVPFLSSI